MKIMGESEIRAVKMSANRVFFRIFFSLLCFWAINTPNKEGMNTYSLKFLFIYLFVDILTFFSKSEKKIRKKKLKKKIRENYPPIF